MLWSSRLLVLVAAGLAVAACAPSTAIVLRNPQTKDLAECKTLPILGDPVVSAEQCAESYERVGYVRLQ